MQVQISLPPSGAPNGANAAAVGRSTVEAGRQGGARAYDGFFGLTLRDGSVERFRSLDDLLSFGVSWCRGCDGHGRSYAIHMRSRWDWELVLRHE